MNLDAITSYVMQNYEPADDWGEEIAAKWIAWHFKRESACTVYDDQENIVGFGAARPVMHVADVIDDEGRIDHEAWDHEGRILFVDCAIGDTPDVLPLLFLQMLRRFGGRPLVAFRRVEDPRVRVYPLQNIRRHLLRKAAIYGRR